MRKKLFVLSLMFIFISALVFSSSLCAENKWVVPAFIGAGAGAAVGVGAGFGLCGVNSGQYCMSKAAGVAMFGGGLALIGFGVGGAIGFMMNDDKKDEDKKDASYLTPQLVVDPINNIYGVGAGMNF